MNDQISRQAAIDTLADMHCKSDEDGYVWIVRSDAWARIDALPSAERRGEWIELYENNYQCSECGAWWTCEETPVESGMNFCPNCGARMVSEDDS